MEVCVKQKGHESLAAFPLVVLLMEHGMGIRRRGFRGVRTSNFTVSCQIDWCKECNADGTECLQCVDGESWGLVQGNCGK